MKYSVPGIHGAPFAGVGAGPGAIGGHVLGEMGGGITDMATGASEKAHDAVIKAETP